jgi:hypothetical protein
MSRIAECCVACLKAPPFADGEGFTEEHILPRALGGILTWPALCKPCNDRFGHTFEKRLKTDPAIRLAIHKLKHALPHLFSAIETGQSYVLESGGHKLPGVFRDGEVCALSRVVDGDLWASAEDAESAVRKKLSKAGLSPEQITDAWARYQDGPESTPIDLGGGLSAASHPTYVLGPDLSKGATLAPLAALKIAYEFAVLSFGSVMLDDNPALNEIRRALLNGDEASPVFNVAPKITTNRRAEPFHGIAFEGNNPHAVIQVRLFGLLAYQVNFPNLRIDAKPFGYRHDLDTGEETSAFRDA